MSRIREEYITTGKVRFVYKHFAILGPESNRSAEASECAAEQDQFWAYHDAIFVDQGAGRSALNDDKLIDLAEQLGLDRGLFGDCLKSGRYVDLVRQESQVIQSLGVRGTPGFVINGTYLAGAQSYEVFVQVLDEQLALAGAAGPADSEVTPVVTETVTEAAATEIEGLVTFPTQPQTHEEDEIDYDQPIPPGGAHSAKWQNCGIYDGPLQLENVMHSLEHGAVWLAYQPDLAAAEVELLRTLVRRAAADRDEPMVILSPHADLEGPIMATAWQVQLVVDEATDPRLDDFLTAYQVGPFTPEPGAPCSGGVGEPVE